MRRKKAKPGADKKKRQHNGDGSCLPGRKINGNMNNAPELRHD
jgi:hypothetical protein